MVLLGLLWCGPMKIRVNYLRLCASTISYAISNPKSLMYHINSFFVIIIIVFNFNAPYAFVSDTQRHSPRSHLESLHGLSVVSLSSVFTWSGEFVFVLSYILIYDDDYAQISNHTLERLSLRDQYSCKPTSAPPMIKIAARAVIWWVCERLLR